MIFLVISSLMIAPALAQTPAQTQDQQTRATLSESVIAHAKTPLTIVAAAEAEASENVVDRSLVLAAASDETTSTIVPTKVKKNNQKKVVIGNKVTKRYHLFGMPGYNKVRKDHRIYFDSEEQAIVYGYHRAANGKDLTGPVSPAGGKTIKNQTILMADDSEESVKSSPEASQKNEKILETKAEETPKPVEKPQKPSDENIQKKPANKETVTEEPKDINQKLQDLQKQVDALREMGHTREKLAVTEQERQSEAKSVLTAVGQEYTMMAAGKIELDYTLRYAYTATTNIVSTTDIATHSNDTITNIIDIQYGLRKNITTDISIPYVYVYDKTGSASALQSSNLGDINLTLDYQPFKSGGDWPTTTIAMTATLPTGSSPYAINTVTELPTGSGMYMCSLGVNMSKAVDPAMVFGGLSASYRLAKSGLHEYINGAILNEVDPGLVFNASIGLAYAFSYPLSMHVQFQYGYGQSTSYHFANVAESTSPAYSTASLVIGVGWRVSQLTTLSFSLGIGLTPNDSNFFFMFRVPFTY